ncbi:MAG: AraC family transcriptional regulator [Chloroflexi bacterium]|nr:MAG: AraC family transcriptional regulator [Chloroflexota bacterium]
METQLTSEVTIETLPALRVACYRVISPTPENDGLAFMEAWVARQNIPGVRKFGFDCEVTEEQGKAGLRGYEQWFTVPKNVTAPEGVTIREFPGGLYAVMTLYRPFEAPFERIPGGWQKLMAWVEASDTCQGIEYQWLEELVPGKEGNDLKLYLPVKMK